MIGMLVDGGIELAHDVVQHARRHSEDRSAVATIRRMTHAIRRVTRKEHRLVHVRRHPAPPKMARKSAVTHQNDVVNGRLFLSPRSALRNVTTIIKHADDRTLVQWPVLQQLFIAGGHGVMVLHFASGGSQ